MKKSKVYFSKEISPQSLIRIYEALGANLPGKIAVKVSTGERGAKGYLKAFDWSFGTENWRHDCGM